MKYLHSDCGKRIENKFFINGDMIYNCTVGHNYNDGYMAGHMTRNDGEQSITWMGRDGRSLGHDWVRPGQFKNRLDLEYPKFFFMF